VWQLFVEALWVYQYTKSRTPLSAELANVLYEQSQGIVDLAAKLYMLAQARAITTSRDEQESLTVDIIRSVALDSFRQAQPVIRALREGDARTLSRYEDMQPLDLQTLLQQSLFEETGEHGTPAGATTPRDTTATTAKKQPDSDEKRKRRSGQRKTAENEYDPDDLRAALDHRGSSEVSAADRLRATGHLQTTPVHERRDAA
jgi:hypothetical protein